MHFVHHSCAAWHHSMTLPPPPDNRGARGATRQPRRCRGGGGLVTVLVNIGQVGDAAESAVHAHHLSKGLNRIPERIDSSDHIEMIIAQSLGDHEPF